MSHYVSPATRFELAYTHTMYYLAQVYKNLGELLVGVDWTLMKKIGSDFSFWIESECDCEN